MGEGIEGLGLYPAKTLSSGFALTCSCASVSGYDMGHKVELLHCRMTYTFANSSGMSRMAWMKP